MFKKYHVFLMSSFFILDIIFSLVAFYLVGQNYPSFLSLKSSSENFYIKGYLYLIIALIWGVVFRLFPIYNSKRAMPIINEVISVSLAVLTSWIIFIGVIFVFGNLNVSRPLLLLFGLLNLVILLTFHTSLRIILRFLRLKGYNLKKVLIIGAGSMGRLIAEELYVRPWTGFSIIGFLDDNLDLLGRTILSIPVLGVIDDIHKIVKTMEKDDEVIIALHPSQHERLVDIIRKIEDIPVNVRVAPDFNSVAYVRPNIEEFWGIPLIGIRSPRIPQSVHFVKRLIDIIGALIGIFIFTPIMILIAILIKVDSEGPVLFIQIRTGENCKTFNIIKFRTMVLDAEDRLRKLVNFDELEEPVFKIQNDPRITRIGRILRRTSLDELPQLFNVLIGNMSLVGPRPEESRLVNRYNSWQRMRLLMKPGMTGPVQINGRGDLSLTARVVLEEEYINNYSLLRDFEILIRTIPSVIRGKGCY